MSYTHPNSPSRDPRPLRHCEECGCVLNADEDFLCVECEKFWQEEIERHEAIAND